MRTILAVLLGFPVSIAAQTPQAPPDLILLNGKVFTADPAKPSAEAVAIRGDRIIATGSSVEIGQRAGAKTRRIDLQGRTVVPGFNDAHFHFDPDPEGSKLELKTMEPTWAETGKAIRAEVAQAPARRWIFAEVGSDVVMNPDVNCFALDRIAPNHPVLIRAYYGHGYIINSKAMRLLQIRDKEPDPVGGYFERVGGSKRINGRFGEYAEWKPSRILANQVDDEDIVKRLRALADEAVRYGITSMQIMSSLSVDKFARLLAKADLPIRVRAISFSMTTPQGRDLSLDTKASSDRTRGWADQRPGPARRATGRNRRPEPNPFCRARNFSAALGRGDAAVALAHRGGNSRRPWLGRSTEPILEHHAGDDSPVQSEGSRDERASSTSLYFWFRLRGIC